MPLLSINENETPIRKPRKQKKTASSSSKPKSHSTSTIANMDKPTESRNTFTKIPRKNNKFFFSELKGLRCKEASVSSSPVSAKHIRNKNPHRRKMSSSNQSNHADVVDVSYVCCTPPGVGIASDFVPRSGGNTTRSTDHQKMRVFQENLLSGRRIHNGSDRYKDWRLDIDDMSYEELLDLSDGIGNVCTGLKQEEISNCLREFRPSNSQDKDWRCSVCQEKCCETKNIGTLECGHHHHLQCIKQWLLQKNSCPVCKAVAI